MRRKIALILTTVTLTGVVLSGCGNSTADNYSYKSDDYGYAVEEAAEEAYYDEDYDVSDGEVYEYSTSKLAAGDNQISDSDIESNSKRKLIKTVNMSVETKEFDKLIDSIQQKIRQLDGYAQSSDISGASFDSSTTRRNAYIVARIPADKLDSFVTYIDGSGNITNKSESAEDVTLQYSDVKARIESLKIEQTRLMELLAQSENLDTIVALESRLTEVRYEIESYESRIRTMDDQVDYSTVNLNISEVKEYKPEPIEEPTFGERLSSEFTEGCEAAWELIQDFIISALSMLPKLLVLLVILGIIALIIFGIVKLIMLIVNKIIVRSKAKKALKMQKMANASTDNKAPTAIALDEKPEIKVEDNE